MKEKSMVRRDVVAIGASAGGIEALKEILSRLPADLDVALLIVLHTSSHARNVLTQILQRVTALPVVHPSNGDPLEKGKIYIAPPDFHLIVEGSLLRVVQGPRENLHRPAIDPLFRSAAASYGPRVIGVVLTGSLDDGTAGLMVVRSRGGEAIVQDPNEAMFSSMPECALEQVPDAHVLPVAEIANAIVRLSCEEVPDGEEAVLMSDMEPERETRAAEADLSEMEGDNHLGEPSTFACPDCGGVLWEMNENGFLRFRCRVGHAYTARHLGAEQRYAIEAALWSALRALEEHAALYRRMADRAANSDYNETARQYQERASNTTENARVLRDFLLRVNKVDENRFVVEQE
jgi:two-component system, chemotaxis family, protein-glutamate methylesterase/glutaminase